MGFNFSVLAIFGLPGGPEVLVILLVGLLLFGGRLPEVGRSLGRSLVEFRKGLRGLKDEVGIDREIHSIRRDLEEASREEPAKAWPESDRKPWNEIEFEDSIDDSKHDATSMKASPADSPDDEAPIVDTEAVRPIARGDLAAKESDRPDSPDVEQPKNDA